MTRDETPPPSLKILEITYSNFVIARALYAFAKLGIAAFWEMTPSAARNSHPLPASTPEPFIAFSAR